MDVLEGVGWETTVATVVVIVTSAINELLLGKGSEALILDQFMSLEGSDGGESPA